MHNNIKNNTGPAFYELIFKMLEQLETNGYYYSIINETNCPFPSKNKKVTFQIFKENKFVVEVCCIDTLENTIIHGFNALQQTPIFKDNPFSF